MAIKLARAFGSGMGQGEVCGALVGGYMILGLTLQGETDEGRARYKTYDLVREFTGHFTARHGTIVCKDLLGGVDPSTEAGRRQALDQKLFTTICPKLVEDAADILEMMV
jgi:C_GCAxxG_C_C family probable redox protein